MEIAQAIEQDGALGGANSRSRPFIPPWDRDHASPRSKEVQHIPCCQLFSGHPQPGVRWNQRFQQLLARGSDPDGSKMSLKQLAARNGAAHSFERGDGMVAIARRNNGREREFGRTNAPSCSIASRSPSLHASCPCEHRFVPATDGRVDVSSAIHQLLRRGKSFSYFQLLVSIGGATEAEGSQIQFKKPLYNAIAFSY